MWPCLVEKALAKMYGGYDKIVGNSIANVLKDLTGAPCEVISTKDVENLYEKIEMYKAKNYLMIAVNETEDMGKSQANELGFKSNIAYQICDTWPQKKVCMRSSFGKIEGFEYNDQKHTFNINMKDLSI